MIASRLNVYVDTYNLVKLLMRAQTQFERMYKYATKATVKANVTKWLNDNPIKVEETTEAE